MTLVTSSVLTIVGVVALLIWVYWQTDKASIVSNISSSITTVVLGASGSFLHWVYPAIETPYMARVKRRRLILSATIVSMAVFLGIGLWLSLAKH